MLDPEVLKLLGPVGLVVVVLAYMGLQAWSGSTGRGSGYPKRDEKHDANQGEFREVKTMIEAGFRNLDRKIDDGMKRMEQMHAEGDRDREAIKHNIAVLLGKFGGM